MSYTLEDTHALTAGNTSRWRVRAVASDGTEGQWSVDGTTLAVVSSKLCLLGV